MSLTSPGGRVWPLAVLAAAMLVGPAGRFARAEPSPPARSVAEEVDAAELWAQLGLGVPAGAAFAFTVVTTRWERESPRWREVTIGSLYGVAGFWGTSLGYYRAGRPLYATLSAFGKMALVAGGTWFEIRMHTGPGCEQHLCDTVPAVGAMTVLGVIAWDVWDYLTLERSVYARASSTAIPAALPTLTASRTGLSLGLAGRF